MAQGIETDQDRELALAMGATHVQGFGIGLPAELSEAPLRIRSLEPVRASFAESAVSPFDLVASSMAAATAPPTCCRPSASISNSRLHRTPTP